MKTHSALLAALAVLLPLAAPLTAHAAVQRLEGQKALEYVGDAKAKFTQPGYTYEILSRSHRDAMNGRFSDAVIFSKKSDRFYYRKRTDGEHIVVIGHAEGREENPVTADALVWKPIENALGDDNPQPNVFLDENGEELAVVYIGRKTRLEAAPAPDGLLEITVKVASSGSQPGARFYRR